MTFFSILLLIILIWMIFGNSIKTWLQRRMMEKVQDSIRQSMGMPTAKEERRRRKEAEKNARKARQANAGFQRSGQNARGNHNRNPFQSKPDSILPKEYAEDVEFTEYKEYSSSSKINISADKGKITVEEQVSDAEFTEIKK